MKCYILPFLICLSCTSTAGSILSAFSSSVQNDHDSNGDATTTNNDVVDKMTTTYIRKNHARHQRRLNGCGKGKGKGDEGGCGKGKGGNNSSDDEDECICEEDDGDRNVGNDGDGLGNDIGGIPDGDGNNDGSDNPPDDGNTGDGSDNPPNDGNTGGGDDGNPPDDPYDYGNKFEDEMSDEIFYPRVNDNGLIELEQCAQPTEQKVVDALEYFKAHVLLHPDGPHAVHLPHPITDYLSCMLNICPHGCCRYHPYGLVCDVDNSLANRQCVCNDYTAEPIIEPSAVPSGMPSVSSVPSAMPTSSPTSTPSESPSLSAAPSQEPTTVDDRATDGGGDIDIGGGGGNNGKEEDALTKAARTCMIYEPPFNYVNPMGGHGFPICNAGTCEGGDGDGVTGACCIEFWCQCRLKKFKGDTCVDPNELP